MGDDVGVGVRVGVAVTEAVDVAVAVPAPPTPVRPNINETPTTRDTNTVATNAIPSGRPIRNLAAPAPDSNTVSPDGCATRRVELSEKPAPPVSAPGIGEPNNASYIWAMP